MSLNTSRRVEKLANFNCRKLSKQSHTIDTLIRDSISEENFSDFTFRNAYERRRKCARRREKCLRIRNIHLEMFMCFMKLKKEKIMLFLNQRKWSFFFVGFQRIMSERLGLIFAQTKVNLREGTFQTEIFKHQNYCGKDFNLLWTVTVNDLLILCFFLLSPYTEFKLFFSLNF